MCILKKLRERIHLLYIFSIYVLHIYILYIFKICICIEYRVYYIYAYCIIKDVPACFIFIHNSLRIQSLYFYP